MAVLPSHARNHPTQSPFGLKLTPSSSPFHHRALSPRSPLKTRRQQQEPYLALTGVVGTTTASPNAFDVSADRRSFVHLAGAAAVLVSVDENLQTSQRFFRARPTAVACPAPAPAPPSGPSTPTGANADSRARTLTPLRDVASSGLPGASPGPDWLDSPSSKTWTARERIKAASCVSLSPDGRFLALGEIGYSPRVLIFSTAADAQPDTPVAVISEHTFGVACVAWSPDSRYLASLGTNQDGFLHVFAVSPRTGAARLHSTNRCTSLVHVLLWLSRSTLFTAGMRHAKVWRLEESRATSPAKPRLTLDGSSTPGAVNAAPKSLAGRNCLLGPLIEATFVCAVQVTDHQAIACTHKGLVCRVDDRDASQRLVKIGQVGFATTCVTVDGDRRHIWLGGRDGKIRLLRVSDVVPASSASAFLSDETPDLQPPPGTPSSSLMALGLMTGRFVTIDESHSITIGELASSPPGPSDVAKASREIGAHAGPILGVQALSQPNELEASYFTWSSDGAVLFWDLAGSLRLRMAIELEQLASVEEDVVNELRVMRASPGGDFFATGDRLGVVRIIDAASKQSVYDVKAHHGDVLDIALHGGARKLMASSGRDRTVQLFQRAAESWTLLQTLNEHSGSVCRVLFDDGGERLISCAGDRTIVVRDLASKETAEQTDIAYLPVRTVALKSAPISMTVSTDGSDALAVSCLDRSIQEYHLSSGRHLSTYRTGDQDGNDTVVMDALTLAKIESKSVSSTTSSTVMAGVSSTDKSIRIYDRVGTLISREWGHTEGVTSLVCLESSERMTLVSTGSDSTIMLWELMTDVKNDDLAGEAADEVSPAKEATASRPPLRKVLSKAELSEFRRKSDPDSVSPLSTPTRVPSPPRTVRKKTSKYGLRAGSTPTGGLSLNGRSYTSPVLDQADSPAFRASLRERSPSPQSARQSHRTLDRRRPSLDTLRGARAKSVGRASEFGSLNMSTEQVCRTLRAYRKKLGPSCEVLRAENVRSLERELSLTIKALGEKVVKTEAVQDEEALVKLLDAYSARLVEMIDRKMSSGSPSGSISASASTSTLPALSRDEEAGPGGEVEEEEEEEENEDGGRGGQRGEGRLEVAEGRGRGKIGSVLETLGEG